LSNPDIHFRQEDSMRFRNLIILALGGIVATACATEDSDSSIDLTAEATAVNEISLRWLEFARAKDAAGIAGLFASDGVLFLENEAPVVGPTAIEARQVQAFEKNPDLVRSFGSDRIEVAASGDLAVEFGSWGPEGPDRNYGKYIAVYRKVDGVWRVAADIGNSAKPISEGSDN